MLQHVLQAVRLAAAPGLDVLELHLLAEIELNDVGHERVDRLVVGDAGADRVGDGDVAGLVGLHDARHAERAVGPEELGIEEVVVDATVDHVDAPRPFGRAHVDGVVIDDEVAPLDELAAELVGQKRVLVIGAVERSGRQQRDRRLAVLRGIDRAQAGEQRVGVVLDGGDAVLGEEVGRDAHHDLAVLQHVGDARRRAHVVLEDVEILRIDAHHVDAGDVHVDVVRHLDADHLVAERRVVLDQLARHEPGSQDLLLAVDVREEGVERLDALHETGLELAPLAALQDARDDVERDEALGRLGVAVDVEGDADAPEHHLGMAAPRGEIVLRRTVEPAGDPLVGEAGLAAALHHLVVTDRPRQSHAPLRPARSGSASTMPHR